MKLDDKPIDWVDQWNYLGVTQIIGRLFGCSMVERVKKFYRSINSILRVEGRSDDLVLLSLLESHCTPLLTYAIEVIHVADQGERRKLRVAYNSVFRRIFGYRNYQSVTDLQHFLGRQTWEEVVNERRERFLKRADMCYSDSLIQVIRSQSSVS